ncbi:MAG: Crp/Fnr family transcriptional regulator [Micrococcus sp.]|nr:Crp/Fnr family transcriptional regulator [Micrococcus sp.]
MRTLPLREIHRDEVSCVRRVPLFSGLMPDQQDLVGALARPMVLSAGELVHGAGERSRRLSVVHTGQVKLSRTLPSGHRRLLRTAGPGQTLGEHGFLTGGPTLEEAEAVTETRLCVFSHDDLARLVAEHPSIALQMLRTLGQRLAEAERRLALSVLDVDARVADYLLDQPLLRRDTSDAGDTASPAEAGSRVRLPLSKKDIASMLGTTPESLSRALARLTAEGLITVDADVITLLDPTGLEALMVPD